MMSDRNHKSGSSESGDTQTPGVFLASPVLSNRVDGIDVSQLLREIGEASEAPNLRGIVFGRHLFLGLILAVAICALCTGCEPVRDPQSPNTTVTILSVYTDEFTGCQYIGQRNSSAGITPRIAADGRTHLGCREGGDAKS
ncbi:hypothetical protein [Massilia sp.]|uniref:hypothetical protein n=1 Tax=Massilia sp. TaxID=1882437 RepID=UPI00352DCD18